MDIISEILNADKIAEDKLKSAEEEKQAILAQTIETEKIMRSDAEKFVEKHKSEIHGETDGEIAAQLEIINKAAAQKKAGLDAYFEKSHAEWERDIFNRIVGL